MSTQLLVSEAYFQDLAEQGFRDLASNEFLVLDLKAEDTAFIRFNHAKIRQTGEVTDAQISLKFFLRGEDNSLRQSAAAFALTGDRNQDLDAFRTHLQLLRKDTANLPVDPFAVVPENRGNSSQSSDGQLLSREDSAAAILKPVQGMDFTGIFTSGAVVRANANSCGQRHWFQSESFLVDYSLYGAAERAYKGYYADSRWNEAAFLQEIETGKERLSLLAQPAREVPRGNHRTYLAPAATRELTEMLTGIFSEASIRQAESPLIRVQQGKASFSAKLSLFDDYRESDTPRFDSEGELAPECTALVENGALAATLINRRTAKEYKLSANGASSDEQIRSLRIAGGDLREADALARLGTGLYLSNLHYLNWSDRPKGRVTGMTRYACFWVENGKIVAPIENMRWDDTLYRMLGSELEAVGANVARFSNTDTYFFRGTATTRVPGLLLQEMQFTL